MKIKVIAIQRDKTTVLSVLITIVILGVMFTTKQKIRLKQIVEEYKSYSLYQDSSKKDTATLQWTIALCAAPATGNKQLLQHIDSFYHSKADPVLSPHGNKLYKLYIKDSVAYFDHLIKKQPLGQVLVKETWNTRPVSGDSLSRTAIAMQNRNDGKWYVPTTVSELFIMYKEKERPGNDKGWVYAIVNLERKKQKPEVITTGKISTCMSCHKATKYDRLFGAN